MEAGVDSFLRRLAPFSWWGVPVRCRLPPALVIRFVVDAVRALSENSKFRQLSLSEFSQTSQIQCSYEDPDDGSGAGHPWLNSQREHLREGGGKVQAAELEDRMEHPIPQRSRIFLLG